MEVNGQYYLPRAVGTSSNRAVSARRYRPIDATPFLTGRLVPTVARRPSKDDKVSGTICVHVRSLRSVEPAPGNELQALLTKKQTLVLAGPHRHDCISAAPSSSSLLLVA